MVYTVKRVGSYRHYTMWSPPVREFVEPNASDSFIHWLFRYRCIECKQSGSEVNEIIPRSRSKKSILNWKNRVLLCRSCHELYHKDGVTKQKVERMQNLRLEFLQSFGRTEYLG
jgi:5-methylcytosine-specific restriction endonuclease McrA